MKFLAPCSHLCVPSLSLALSDKPASPRCAPAAHAERYRRLAAAIRLIIIRVDIRQSNYSLIQHIHKPPRGPPIPCTTYHTPVRWHALIAPQSMQFRLAILFSTKIQRYAARTAWEERGKNACACGAGVGGAMARTQVHNERRHGTAPHDCAICRGCSTVTWWQCRVPRQCATPNSTRRIHHTTSQPPVPSGWRQLLHHNQQHCCSSIRTSSSTRTTSTSTRQVEGSSAQGTGTTPWRPLVAGRAV